MTISPECNCTTRCRVLTNCKTYKAAYARKWRKAHPLQGEAKVRANARSLAGVYKRRGLLEERPCEVCGQKAEMHHDDYSKPLKVRWLCRQHHLRTHGIPAINTERMPSMESKWIVGVDAMMLFIRHAHDVCGDDRDLLARVCGAHNGSKGGRLTKARAEIAKRCRPETGPRISFPDLGRFMAITHTALVHQCRNSHPKLENTEESAFHGG